MENGRYDFQIITFQDLKKYPVTPDGEPSEKIGLASFNSFLLPLIRSGKLTLKFLFDQAPSHSEDSQRKKDHGKKQKKGNMPQYGEMDRSITKGSCKIDEMREWKDEGDSLGPQGEILNGEKGPAEEKHRRNK